LFIDSSKVSLTTEILDKGNQFPSLTLVHVAKVKVSYENKKL